MGLLLMARIRTMKPDFFGSPKTAKVSIPARLLMLGLLTEADDEGKLLGSPKRVAGAVFPNDDAVTPRKVAGWLDELEGATFIERYVVDGVEYVIVPGFDEHQRISHPTPSKLPNPSGKNRECFALSRAREEQGTGNREVRTRGTRIPETFEVTDTMVEWVTRECPLLDWDHHTKRFVNYWKAKPGAGAVKVDWERTWQNWMMQEHEPRRT